MTDPVQVEVIMNHSIALVVRALNKYVYDLTTYLQIGVVQNKDIYCIPKQKLADSLIKAFKLLDDKPLLLINVLPVTYTSSTKATYDDTYEWVKAGRQTEYSAPRRANNKFLVGNDMYSLQVEAYMSTYLCLKERLDRVADGGIF
jgi:hypothetical protein